MSDFPSFGVTDKEPTPEPVKKALGRVKTGGAFPDFKPKEDSVITKGAKAVAGGAAWLGDTLLSTPSALVQGGAYTALRGIGATVPQNDWSAAFAADPRRNKGKEGTAPPTNAQTAMELSQKIAPNVTFFEDLAKKAGISGPGEAISSAVEKGSKWLADRTGTKPEDIETATNTFLSATGMKAGDVTAAKVMKTIQDKGLSGYTPKKLSPTMQAGPDPEIVRRSFGPKAADWVVDKQGNLWPGPDSELSPQAAFAARARYEQTARTPSGQGASPPLPGQKGAPPYVHQTAFDFGGDSHAFTQQKTLDVELDAGAAEKAPSPWEQYIQAEEGAPAAKTPEERLAKNVRSLQKGLSEQPLSPSQLKEIADKPWTPSQLKGYLEKQGWKFGAAGVAGALAYSESKDKDTAALFAMFPVLGMKAKEVIKTPEFKVWFKGSQVLDKTGQPRVMFHGTSTRKAGAFDPKVRKEGIREFNPKTSGTTPAIFVTPSPDFASQFAGDLYHQDLTDPYNEPAGGHVYPVFVRATNLFDHENPAHVDALMERLNEKGGYKTEDNSRYLVEHGDWETMEHEEIQNAIREMGHDGFTMHEGNAKNIAVYNPEQIKSATGNVGRFSWWDKDITRMAAAGAGGIAAYEATKDKDSQLLAGLVPFFMMKGKERVAEVDRLSKILAGEGKETVERLRDKVAGSKLPAAEVQKRLEPFEKALQLIKEGRAPLKGAMGEGLGSRASGTSPRALGISPRDLEGRGPRSQEGRADPRTLIAGSVILMGGIAGMTLSSDKTEGFLAGAAIPVAAAAAIGMGRAVIDHVGAAFKAERQLSISNFQDHTDAAINMARRDISYLTRALVKAVPSRERRAAITEWLRDGGKTPLSGAETRAAESLKAFLDGMVQQGVDEATLKDVFAGNFRGNSPFMDVIKREGPLSAKDSALLLNVYGNSLMKSLERRNLIQVLKNAPERFVIPESEWSKYPTYVRMDHPQLRGLLVNPDIVGQMRFTFTSEPGAGMKAAQLISSIPKRWAVSFSMFHAKALLDAFIQASLEPKKARDVAYMGAGAAAGYALGSELAPHKDKEILFALGGAAFIGRAAGITHDMMDLNIIKTLEQGGERAQRFLKSGAEVTFVGADPAAEDVGRGLYQGLRMLQEAANKTIPGMGELVGAAEKANRVFDAGLWPRLHAGFKFLLWDHTVNKLEQIQAKRAQKGLSVLSQEEIDRTAASYVNDVFGGLNWRQAASEARTKWGRNLAEMVYSPQGRRTLQLLMFAPDWTVATSRAFFKTFKFGGDLPQETLRKLHQGYVLRSALYYAMTADALNYGLSGHHIWQNDNPFMIDVGDGTHIQWSKHATEAPRWLVRPLQQAMDKQSTLLREAETQAFNQEYLSAKGAPHIGRAKGEPTTRQRFEHLRKNVSPITFEAQGSDSTDTAGRMGMSFLGVPRYGETDEQKRQRKLETKKEVARRRSYGIKKKPEE